MFIASTVNFALERQRTLGLFFLHYTDAMVKGIEIKKSEKKKNFRIINRTGITDTCLSLKAKGVLWYLLDKPDGWRGQIYDIVSSSSKDGLKSVRSAIKELQEHGYVVLKSNPMVDGKFQGKYYEVVEEPKNKNK